jgi:hypothetical protein
MGLLCVTDPDIGFTTKKYGVSISCCRKLAFFDKTECSSFKI